MKQTLPEVAILGGGPSAAYAFQACKDYGCPADVFTDEFSHPAGAFWLHWVPEDAFQAAKPFMRKAISIPLGTAAGYASKMWGDPTVPTSFPRQGEDADTVWDPLFLRHYMWQGCEPISGKRFKDDDVLRLALFYKLILQTFPTDGSKLTQPRPHFFPIMSRRTMNTIDVLCIYNGMLGTPWVRTTIGFNQISIEYPSKEAMESDLRQDRGHNWTIQSYPDMLPNTTPVLNGVASNVVLLGRAATWDRKALSHEAYKKTLRMLSEFGIRSSKP